MLGIGSRNLRAIAIGPDRGMRADLLGRAIDEDRRDGITPIAVVATARTTLTGAIDPLDELADVCEARGVWLHIDGAYGLPAASVRPDLFRGFERAQSVSVDAHKWLYLPKACGVVLVRQGGPRRCVRARAGYLPHQRHELHAVDITFEYSRPFRALKLWLAMRAHGAAAFREAIQRNLAEASCCTRRSRRRPTSRRSASRSCRSCRSATPEGVGDLNEHTQRLADALRPMGASGSRAP